MKETQEIILCKCGCGESVQKSNHKPFNWNVYIHGHNGKGKPRSEEIKHKIQKAQKGKVNIGKHYSPKTEIKKNQHLSILTELKKGNQLHLGYHQPEDVKVKLSNLHKNKRIIVKCDFCKKELSLIQYRFRNNEKHFCSVICRQSFNKGENNNKWKGGVTPINTAIRHSLFYLEWRKQVFARDNYTCQKCGLVSGNIHAHHIKQFYTHPELRFELSNGITYCNKCHDKHHGIIRKHDTNGRFSRLKKEIGG